MYSNIVLGHLTHQSKAFYGVLLNDAIEISRLIPKFSSLLNSRIIPSGSVFSVTNTHDWIRRYINIIIQGLIQSYDSLGIFNILFFPTSSEKLIFR